MRYPFRLAPGLFVVVLLSLGTTSISFAQSAGSIEGRVQHAVTGDYLNNARVSVKGTNLVALSDEGGAYRLDNVPAGTVTLRVLFSGLDEQELSVPVIAGQVSTQDLKLTSATRHGESAAVQLDKFLVESTRETDAAMIAVNEQRFALGQKSVISTDQFGTIPDNNPGEFMKWLPGVSVEYFANNIVA
jgi:iron complex outermembrane recepter protein